MRTKLWMTASALSLLALAACSKAQSPAEVQHDVTSAANTAAVNNAQAGEKQADLTSAANKDLGEAAQKADAEIAGASADAAVTAAEGQHKVASAKCGSLSGNAQKACKDEADAALEMAKAKASAYKASHS
jgi:hypothetical protein